MKMHDYDLIFVFLVWFSFQMPSVFCSADIFNSILFCCLSGKVPFTDTTCFLSQLVAFQPAPDSVCFLPTGPPRTFSLCSFTKTALQKLYFYAIQSSILPKIQETILPTLEFQVRGGTGL